MSDTARVAIAVPTGTVRDMCRSFEQRIALHCYERDFVYIARMTRNMKKLARHARTYDEQLRAAEQATLFNLPEHLVHFLRDHNNLMHAGIRNYSAAEKARLCPNMSPAEQVTNRLHNLRTTYYINLVETRTEHRRLSCYASFVGIFNECTELLQDDIVSQLTRLAQLNSEMDIELENIGPDHNLDDFGHELPPTAMTEPSDHRYQSLRCCICLEGYTCAHQPFLIVACRHTVGKPCLAQWLNSTCRSANLCPHCRTPLCQRRPRHPRGLSSTIPGEYRNTNDRIRCAVVALEECVALKEELFGPEVADEYTRETMDDLNYRLFENDIGYCMDWLDEIAGKLCLREMSWH